jgi:hypothetical protein
MVLMVSASIIFAWRSFKMNDWLPDSEATKLNLEQPFSLPAALKFGLLFLALHVAGTLAQRYLGIFGFYAVSIAGKHSDPCPAGRQSRVSALVNSATFSSFDARRVSNKCPILRCLQEGSRSPKKSCYSFLG